MVLPILHTYEDSCYVYFSSRIGYFVLSDLVLG
jgi:hypothetical protein